MPRSQEWGCNHGLWPLQMEWDGRSDEVLRPAILPFVVDVSEGFCTAWSLGSEHVPSAQVLLTPVLRLTAGSTSSRQEEGVTPSGREGGVYVTPPG